MKDLKRKFHKKTFLTSSDESFSKNPSPHSKKTRQRKNKGWSDRPSKIKSRQPSAIPRPKEKLFLQDRGTQRVNFTPSGILLHYYNRERGITLKFSQPQDKAKAGPGWRLYPFETSSSKSLQPICLEKKSRFVMGNDTRICDIVEKGQQVSDQHAVIQFRGSQGRPFLLDLQSAGRTLLNKQKIEGARFYQLFPNDTIRLGQSHVDYLLISDTKVI